MVLAVTASADGRITLARDQRLLDPAVAERWAALQPDGAFASRFDELHADVILEGSGSFVDDSADAPVRPVAVLSDDELRRDHVPRRSSKWFVVADGRGRVDWTFTGDDTMPLHVLVCDATPLGYLQRLRDLGVGYFVVGDAAVDLRAALRRIHEVFGATRVIANSGGTINAALLRDGLVDILDIVTIPGLVGGRGTPSVMDGPQLGRDDSPIRLQLLDCRVDNGAVRTRYRVQRSAAG